MNIGKLLETVEKREREREMEVYRRVIFFNRK